MFLLNSANELPSTIRPKLFLSLYGKIIDEKVIYVLLQKVESILLANNNEREWSKYGTLSSWYIGKLFIKHPRRDLLQSTPCLTRYVLLGASQLF